MSINNQHRCALIAVLAFSTSCRRKLHAALLSPAGRPRGELHHRP